MRVIVRKERPHPGAQLRFDDVDGIRITAFATNTTRGQLPDLELRHRRRARCEDRIRIAKDTGLANLPLHGFDANRIWCAIVALAADLTAWTQMLAFTATDARRWEPKRLRLRLFTIAATLARTGRRVRLHLRADHPGPHCPRPGSTAWQPSPRLSTAPTVPTTQHDPRPWNRRPPRTTAGPVTPTRQNQTRTRPPSRARPHTASPMKDRG